MIEITEMINICTECQKDADWIVRVGEESSSLWETATVWLCSECLQKAIDLIEEERANRKEK